MRAPALLPPAEYAGKVKQVHAAARAAGRDPAVITLTLRVPLQVYPARARPGLIGLAGTVEGQPVRFDPLARHAARFDQLRFDIRLDLQCLSPQHGVSCQRVQDSLAPGNMRLSHGSELAQQADGGCIGQWIRGVRMVDITADQVRLQHPVDGSQASYGIIQLPDRFTQAGKLIRARLLAVARRA